MASRLARSFRLSQIEFWFDHRDRSYSTVRTNTAANSFSENLLSLTCSHELAPPARSNQGRTGTAAVLLGVLRLRLRCTIEFLFLVLYDYMTYDDFTVTITVAILVATDSMSMCHAASVI